MRRTVATVGLVLAWTWLLAASGAAASGATAAASGATAASPFGVFTGATVGGAAIPCPPDTDGVRVCHGTGTAAAGDLRVRSFDGVPLEVWVVLPPAPADGSTDPSRPLIVQIPSWGAPPSGPDDPQYGGPTARTWAQNGYAVLQMEPRGFGGSCGPGAPVTPAGASCARGYTHLDDARYEGRDIQTAVGALVDEGIVAPGAVAVTGAADGGALALELATLRDRVMEPDGALAPWRSPAGAALAIAAAAPVDPWSDLAAALLPNGRTPAEGRSGASAGLLPFGVEHEGLVGALSAVLRSSAFATTDDRDAAIPAWLSALDAGAPYDKNPLMLHVTAELERYRSPWALLSGSYGTEREPPAPLLFAVDWGPSGFGAEEPFRYISRERALFPAAAVNVLAGDLPGLAATRDARMAGFFAAQLQGASPPSDPAVEAGLATCPPGGGTTVAFAGATLGALHPGQVSAVARGAQTVTSAAGDPIGPTPCVVAPLRGGRGALPPSGTAGLALPAAANAGFTLIGAPIVSAQLGVRGRDAVLAARLWDVDPAAGNRTLVTRGVLRLDNAAPGGPQRFALEPTAWHVTAGHVLALEVLGGDAPWLRPERGRVRVTVSDLTLTVPVHETPGGSGLGVTVARFGSRPAADRVWRRARVRAARRA